MGKVCTAYTAAEKLAAVKYAEEHGNRAAGQEYSINEANIRTWRKQKTSLQKIPRTKQAVRGQKPAHPEIEQVILEWIRDRRKQGIAVTVTEIRLQAMVVAKKRGTTFKASVSWSYAFLRQHDLSIRCCTHTARKLPEDYKDKLVAFQRFIINMRQEHYFELSQIGNADQTPLTFDLPQSTTVNIKGARDINICTTGNEKNRFTVMLACTADGGKLPPYVVFKRKTLPKGVKWPKGVHVRCQEKG